MYLVKFDMIKKLVDLSCHLPAAIVGYGCGFVGLTIAE
jgi:hypothetical protein